MAQHKMNPQSTKTPVSELDCEMRVNTFDEVCLGYTQQEAQNEALRCAGCKNMPCVSGCPVGVHIPQFIEHIVQGDFEAAYTQIKENNSLPAICGRVCPQETQCEKRCTRAYKGEAVAIGRLERFVADWAQNSGLAKKQAQQKAAFIKDRSTKLGRVALVGSGPASLTCAGALCNYGIQAVIFEALHVPGGVLSYGIPEFRLPKALVASEIGLLQLSGVEIRKNAFIGKLFSIEELMGKMGFDAVFLGTGAGLPRWLDIDGEELNGVCVANELLARVNLMHAYEFPHYATPVYAGNNCVVVGGGNVAMDAARTARRLGSKVHIVYRRSEAEMPARKEEIEHAKQEGVVFDTLTNPVRAIGNADNWIVQLECIKMELGDADESGRRRPIPVKGSQFAMDCDMLIVAAGSRTNPLVIKTTPGLEADERNVVKVDEKTGATSLPGVYAGGDIATGAATVIKAMGAGRQAAAAIAHYLEDKKKA